MDSRRLRNQASPDRRQCLDKGGGGEADNNPRLTNFTVCIPAGAVAGPLREVKINGNFASCRSFARRKEVFPVAPVRSSAIVQGFKRSNS